jgi:hypothetical protein
MVDVGVKEKERKSEGGRERESDYGMPWARKPYRRGRLYTVDLLIKVACFVKRHNNIFNIKMS